MNHRCVAHNSIRLNCHFARQLILAVVTFISRGGRWNAALWSPCLWSVITERRDNITKWSYMIQRHLTKSLMH